MTWSNVTTIPRSKKIMLKTGTGMEVIGSVRPGAKIEKNKKGLFIEGSRYGLSNKSGYGSVRVFSWKPLEEQTYQSIISRPIKKRGLRKSKTPVKTEKVLPDLIASTEKIVLEKLADLVLQSSNLDAQLTLMSDIVRQMVKNDVSIKT